MLLSFSFLYFLLLFSLFFSPLFFSYFVTHFISFRGKFDLAYCRHTVHAKGYISLSLYWKSTDLCFFIPIYFQPLFKPSAKLLQWLCQQPNWSANIHESNFVHRTSTSEAKGNFPVRLRHWYTNPGLSNWTPPHASSVVQRDELTSGKL